MHRQKPQLIYGHCLLMPQRRLASLLKVRVNVLGNEPAPFSALFLSGSSVFCKRDEEILRVSSLFILLWGWVCESGLQGFCNCSSDYRSQIRKFLMYKDRHSITVSIPYQIQGLQQENLKKWCSKGYRFLWSLPVRIPQSQEARSAMIGL